MNDLTLAILQVGQSPDRVKYRRLSHPPYYWLEAVSWPASLVNGQSHASINYFPLFSRAALHLFRSKLPAFDFC
jgi:hypothetical protein